MKSLDRKAFLDKAPSVLADLRVAASQKPNVLIASKKKGVKALASYVKISWSFFFGKLLKV